MRIEQGVKVISPSDFRHITEHCVYENYPDNYGRIHFYHVKNQFGLVCTCDKKEEAIKIAKLLNEDLKKGDV